MKNYPVHCTITGCGPKAQLEKCFFSVLKDFDNIFDQRNIDINLDSFDYFTKYEESYAGIRFVLFTQARNLEWLFKQSLVRISNGYNDLILILTIHIPDSESKPKSYFYTCGNQKTVAEIASKYLKKALHRAEYEKQNANKDYAERMLEELSNSWSNDLGCLLDSNSFLRKMRKLSPHTDCNDEHYQFSDQVEENSLKIFPDPSSRKLFS